MKILQINKFYHSFGRSGGVGKYLIKLNQLLELHGHKIIHFGMKDKHTINTPYYNFFVNEMDLSKAKFSLSKFKNAGHIIYSFEAKNKLEELIKKEKPDIAHIHNIYHHISPSILTILKKYNIPVIQTLHDFKLICPNYSLYTQGKVCERCKRRRYYQAILHRCLKNSISASTLVCLEMYIHKFLKIYEKNVEIFICPSKFVQSKIIEFGINPKQTVQLSHFIDLKNYSPQYISEKNYILYFGRLAQGKGVETLIKAINYIKPAPTLFFAGTGPQKKKIEYFINKKGLEQKIKLLGFLSSKELNSVIKSSLFTIAPSEIYETFGLNILESFALGKPVIASQLGAFPELVEDQKTGLLFKAGNYRDLAQKIKYLLEHKEKIEDFGKLARKKAEKYAPEKHYQELIDIYKKFIKK